MDTTDSLTRVWMAAFLHYMAYRPVIVRHGCANFHHEVYFKMAVDGSLLSMSDNACVFRLLHMLLDDEVSACRIMGHLCKTWLFHFDDINISIQTFLDDVFFAPIQLTLTKENIGIWPTVNALLTISPEILSVQQMSMVRDVPKSAGTFFSLQVGVVADTPMWCNCELNTELDESTGSRFYLLKGFLKSLVLEIEQSCQDNNTLRCMLNQLRIALLSSVSSALHIHSCNHKDRVTLLRIVQNNLQADVNLSTDSVINNWLKT